MTTALPATLDTDTASFTSSSGNPGTKSSAVGSMVLALVLLAASVVSVLTPPVQDVAASTGPGWHNHGSISCGSNGSISVSGAQTQRNGSGGPGGTSTVYYRAIAYQWNGSSWSFSSATPWQVRYPFGYGIATFSTAGFTVNRSGFYAVKTEFFWYDYRGQVFYGNSSGWASNGAYCTYR